MSFYEGSARVPLIVWSPERFAPGRVGAAVSTMDLLPTLTDLAGIARVAADASGRWSGRSTGGALVARAWSRTCLALPAGTRPSREYLAEGAIAPIVMIRRGQHKFIHSPPDPDQLYDLAADPGEQVNLAGDPAAARTSSARSARRSRRAGISPRSTGTSG